MSVEVWILVATAVLAAIAICAAVVAVRAVRRLPAAPDRPQTAEPGDASTAIAVVDPAPTHEALPPRVVEGRLVIPPSQQQVVNAALGRPGVRLSVLAHGVAHALRAESRDRIAALMRREYRRRRRERLQAGRRAVRTARPTPPADQWLGS